jgi:uncharacterized surface protein with fasciclin (FAS1) repeats
MFTKKYYKRGNGGIYIKGILSFESTFVFLLILGAATCTASAQENGMNTIANVTEENGNLTTFFSVINATNLTHTLSEKGPFTVFAPTDEAFAALPNGTLEELMNNTSALKEILLYHIAKGKLTTADIVNMSNITTLEGQNLSVNVTGQGIFVGNASIVMSDINASNGVIHVIDKVLIPPVKPPHEFKVLCSGKAPLRVKFLDRNTKHTNWYWSFGDGKASRSQNILHIYKTPGKYPVKLTVKTSGHYKKIFAGYIIVR